MTPETYALNRAKEKACSRLQQLNVEFDGLIIDYETGEQYSSAADFIHERMKRYFRKFMVHKMNWTVNYATKRYHELC